jgi:hypothetical protein
MQACRVSFAALVDYQEGRMEVAAAQELETHLQQGCETCRARLTQLQRVLEALGRRDLLETPAPVYAKLKAAYRERYAAGPSRPPLVARPVYDSRRLPAFVGARGGTGEAFQVIHSTAEHDIHLWAEKQNEKAWYLIGQVLPHVGGDSIKPELASLQSPDGVQITAAADGTEFHLATVPAGSYTLHLYLSKGEVVVPDIAVGL